MPGDSFCIQYTNCTGCPKNVENILVYRNLPKGEHIPKDKCTQNCMLFMIKGELLINSEEHPGITLRERQIVLQAIGSKVEILALTDVEYVVYWFNELPLLCEDRYREMMEQAEAPLTYTPLIMSERLYHLVTSMPEFLAEENPCSKYIDLKCKELVFLITNFYPLPQQGAPAFFELKDVTIGINFHWERKEVQKFKGELKIIVEGEQLTAINIISIEEYLISVISSEMSATASLELLKAHAVISRSWLLNKWKTESRKQEMKNEKTGKSIQKDSATCSPSFVSDSQFIKWYDHEAHKNFDVCADDHCQRYQGITRASTPQAIEAVTATRGEVLMYAGTICDARFSKCCGGAFEEFQNCWENVKHPYLIGQRDCKIEDQLPDLTIETEADKWIRTSPVAFCHTQDKKILSQVLNNYDQETTDFYRWKVCYSQQELSTLIHQRSGIDFGQILDLIPIERGTSGRLVRLKIVGTLRTLIIGKELEIRRTLSTSHLYSSAFVIDKEYKEKGHKKDKNPSRFILIGAGWGHGVGLCQIGAAVMGEQGYKYEEILSHYYPGSTLEKQYQ